MQIACGPSSRGNMQLLKYLIYDVLVCEVSYLKATIDKALRCKQKVNTGVGNKYKFQNLPRNDLETGMRSVLPPAKGPMMPVETLLATMFS